MRDTTLADAGIRYLAANQPETDDPRAILRAVLTSAYSWLAILKEVGHLPVDSFIVIHSRDAEGRQKRIDLETGEETL